jgi:hypothetical protein
VIKNDANQTEDELTREQAAAYLSRRAPTKITPRTLEKWASNNNQGKGPAFIRYGWRTVRYKVSDLDVWLELRKTRASKVT